jgi:hypothetical protein
VSLPDAAAVNNTEHLPPDRLQEPGVSEPEPVSANVTFPVGLSPVPVAVSVTVAVHVEATFTVTGVVHETEMLVNRTFTVILLLVVVELLA